MDRKEFIYIMKKHENTSGILLKMDIEGSEYNIIDLIGYELIKNRDK